MTCTFTRIHKSLQSLSTRATFQIERRLKAKEASKKNMFPIRINNNMHVPNLRYITPILKFQKFLQRTRRFSKTLALREHLAQKQ